jgi:DeoR/GlpR family transcriptional regulator of sugar metabolism
MQRYAEPDPHQPPDLRTSPEERRRWLLERLGRDGRLVAAALAQELDTSEDTIRRDLRELAAAGLVQRVHGGALPPSPGPPTFAARRERATEAKDRLAAAAVDLVRDGQVVLLDGGTTNLAFARRLPRALRLTVVTPSPAVAMALAEHPGVEAVLLGGRLDRASQTVVGGTALAAVRSLRADLCVLGVCSLDAEMGVTATGYEETELKRAMVASAGEVAALITADKLGTAAPFVVGTPDILHHVVTERAAPAALLAGLSTHGITFRLA